MNVSAQQVAVFPDGTYSEQTNEFSFNEAANRFLDMLELLATGTSGAEAAKRRFLMLQSPQSSEQFGQRTGMEPGA